MDILTVSSKGQVVLPGSIRKSLSIEAGSKLIAYASDDYIMLKLLRLPSEDEFSALLDEAKAWAASAGYTESDVDRIIKETRRKKHA